MPRNILSNNSKMNVPSYGVHTNNCNVGLGLNDNQEVFVISKTAMQRMVCLGFVV